MNRIAGLTIAILCFTASVFAQSEKIRVIVLTDIENEPDDAQSMVRFLTYANHWEVEGLIATTSVHKKNTVAAWRIKEIVEAYGKVRDNLERHEPGFPEKDDLLSVIEAGYPAFGMEGVGPGRDTEGSQLIVRAVDKADDRPVWVLVWGGPNCLAQALWKVKMTRTPAELSEFVSRLRVYTISDQDDSAPWIRKNFPELFYIASPGFHANGGYHYATWTGISGDRFHGRFEGANFEIVDNPWLDEHVRSHGPLGAEYPHTEFLMEGDSPSFLYLINNGLGDPENPDYGSWGGRYEFYTPRFRKWFYEPETRPFWSNAQDEVQGVNGGFYTGNQETIWRWRAAYQNDFAARMDWTIQPYEKANHPPAPALGHPESLKAESGQTVTLSAEGATDPDGDELTYQWIFYGEPGTFAAKDPVKITNANAKTASFVVPKVKQPQTLHFILSVTDNGTPALTRYKRVVVTAFSGKINSYEKPD